MANHQLVTCFHSLRLLSAISRTVMIRIMTLLLLLVSNDSTIMHDKKGERSISARRKGCAGGGGVAILVNTDAIV